MLPRLERTSVDNEMPILKIFVIVLNLFFRVLTNHVNITCGILECHEVPVPTKENFKGNPWIYDANVE